MKHIPIKLGPLALLLTVVSICMTVLGLLAFTTARADLSLAGKYGDTVKVRYELEAEGQRFLGEAARKGVVPGEDGVMRKDFTKEGFTLTVGIVPGREGEERIVEWSIRKEWEPESEIGSLWPGE